MNHKVLYHQNEMEFETLEDILPEKNVHLDMIIVGKVPSPVSVNAGHYFQGKHGKALWNKLVEYGILKKITAYHDDSLLKNDIGITDLVKKTRYTDNEPSMEEYRSGKERLDFIVTTYQPKVLFFVYKRALEACVPFLSKIQYGFNDNLNCHFNGSRVFLFPMPGTGKVTKSIIEASLTSLKQYLTK